MTQSSQPEAQGEQPTLICSKCGTDRFKEDCKGERAKCPLVGTTRPPVERQLWDHVDDAWVAWQARGALGKQPTQEADAWKKAVDDELALCESTVSSFPDARAAVRGLIDWHVRNQEAPADAKDAGGIRDVQLAALQSHQEAK